MIYKKEANFPYPILSPFSSSYEESDFTIKVEFEENNEVYRFKIISNLASRFFESLLKSKEAQYILVIQSKDTKFFPLDSEHLIVEIAKNRMSLSSRTSIQMHIVSKADVSFSANEELTSFYDSFKESIIVAKNSMLGYSNIITFEGGMKNPLDLFEKRLDPNLNSAIKYELGTECIIIHFREEDFQFPSISRSGALLNPYIYTGLRIALERFIVSYAEEDEESVLLSDISQPDDLLDFKLYNLMVNKAIVEVSSDNIDEIIDRITNQIIEKFVKAVKELNPNAG